MNYNAVKNNALFTNPKMIHIASDIVKKIRKFETKYPIDDPKSEQKQKKLDEYVYKSAPNPKLTSLKYLYLYINDIDYDGWQGETDDARAIASSLVQNALESGIAGDNYSYFERKVKSDLVLAEYLKGGNITEARLKNALDGLDEDHEYLKKEARRLSNHDLRYDAMRTRNAHEKKMRSLQGALENKRLHGVVVINPNKSRSLGLRNRVRRALKF
jgi:hypothetical protein